MHVIYAWNKMDVVLESRGTANTANVRFSARSLVPEELDMQGTNKHVTGAPCQVEPV